MGHPILNSCTKWRLIIASKSKVACRCFADFISQYEQEVRRKYLNPSLGLLLCVVFEVGLVKIALFSYRQSWDLSRSMHQRSKGSPELFLRLYLRWTGALVARAKRQSHQKPWFVLVQLETRVHCTGANHCADRALCHAGTVSAHPSGQG